MQWSLLDGSYAMDHSHFSHPRPPPIRQYFKFLQFRELFFFFFLVALLLFKNSSTLFSHTEHVVCYIYLLFSISLFLFSIFLSVLVCNSSVNAS